MGDPALFDMEPVAPPPVPDDLSADQRRTQRQQLAIDSGRHPLSLILPGLRLHPDADRTAGPDAAKGRPFTCGSCSHRHLFAYHNRSYAKCDQTSMSHSATSDVRAWWPACVRYEAGDPGLSPDAARYIPC